MQSSVWLFAPTPKHAGHKPERELSLAAFFAKVLSTPPKPAAAGESSWCRVTSATIAERAYLSGAYLHQNLCIQARLGTPKNRRPLSARDHSSSAHAASRALLATHALKTMHPGSTPHWGGLRALVVALVLQRAHARPRATCCRCAEPLALAGRLRPIFGFLVAASKIFQVEVQKTAEITCIDFCHFGGWSARACEVPLCGSPIRTSLIFRETVTGGGLAERARVQVPSDTQRRVQPQPRARY